MDGRFPGFAYAFGIDAYAADAFLIGVACRIAFGFARFAFAVDAHFGRLACGIAVIRSGGGNTGILEAGLAIFTLGIARIVGENAASLYADAGSWAVEAVIGIGAHTVETNLCVFAFLSAFARGFAIAIDADLGHFALIAAASTIWIDANAVEAFFAVLAAWDAQIAGIEACIGGNFLGNADANVHLIAFDQDIIGCRRLNRRLAVGFGIFAYAVDAYLFARTVGHADIGDDAFLIDANGFGIIAGTIVGFGFYACSLEAQFAIFTGRGTTVGTTADAIDALLAGRTFGIAEIGIDAFAIDANEFSGAAGVADARFFTIAMNTDRTVGARRTAVRTRCDAGAVKTLEPVGTGRITMAAGIAAFGTAIVDGTELIRGTCLPFFDTIEFGRDTNAIDAELRCNAFGIALIDARRHTLIVDAYIRMGTCRAAGIVRVDTHEVKAGFFRRAFGIALPRIDAASGNAGLANAGRLAELRVVANAVDAGQAVIAWCLADTRGDTAAVHANFIIRTSRITIIRFEHTGTIKTNAACGTRLMANISGRHAGII